jgi:hypothetical protein
MIFWKEKKYEGYSANESKPNYGFQNSYDDYYKKDFKKYETKKEDNKFEKKDVLIFIY